MRRDVLWWLIGLGILAAAGTGVYVALRGVRNNNPGNIDRTTIKWKGMSPVQSDARFITFVAPEWGFRAIARILLGDFHEGQNTVHSLINEWAPPTENDTGAYVKAVAKAVGVGIDEPFNVPAKLPQLLDAIARHENAGYRYPPDVILKGIDLEKNA